MFREIISRIKKKGKILFKTKQKREQKEKSLSVKTLIKQQIYYNLFKLRKKNKNYTIR